jgi:hypothetical protein
MITITITNTIAIAIAIAIISIRPRPNAHTSSTIDGKRVQDSAGKSESEICSLQDGIVYLSCGI